jgi:hypothetical protein
MRSFAMLICFMLLAATCSFAGPVLPTDIDAQAVWYGHVDMEAIMQLAVVKDLHKSAMKKKRKNYFNQVFQKIGMRLMSEFLSATMYATQYEGEFGVILMKFRSDLPKENLHAIFAQKFPEHKETSLCGRNVYTWQMRCGRKQMCLSGCFVNDRQILIGIDLHHLDNALKVLDKQRESANRTHPLFKGLTPGTLFISRALDVPATYQFSTYCPVLRHCNEAFARWTCLDNNIRARYEFQATDQEKATLYQKAIEGMKAMFSLRFADYDEVMPLLDGFSNIQAGKAVILTWEGSEDQVKKAATQIRQQRKLQKKMRREYDRK